MFEVTQREFEYYYCVITTITMLRTLAKKIPFT